MVFIFVDAPGWGDLGGRGNLFCRTPNPNRTADGGVLFKQARYAAVTEMDVQIGRLLDWIDSRPALAEETRYVCGECLGGAREADGRRARSVAGSRQP